MIYAARTMTCNIKKQKENRLNRNIKEQKGSLRFKKSGNSFLFGLKQKQIRFGFKLLDRGLMTGA
jgi:hypothetical protein